MLGKIKNIFKPEKIILNNGKEVQPKASVAPFVIIGLFLSLIVAGDVTGFNFETIIKRGNEFFVILKDMFPPNFDYMKTVIPPLIETIKISVLGSLIGSFIAIPFAMLCSVNINKSKIILNLVRVVMSITRTLPTLIIALISTYIFGLGTFAGTVAISIFLFLESKNLNELALTLVIYLFSPFSFLYLSAIILPSIPTILPFAI